MRRIRLASALSALALTMSCPAYADDSFPNRAIRIIVPFGGSSGMDPVARTIAERLQEQMKVAVFVESREGAGGQIGVTAAAASTPDGYTILLAAHPPFAIQPFLRKNPTYDPNKLTPIARVVTVPLMLIASKKAPFENFSQMVAYAKQNPGKLLYGSPGIGTASHSDMERLKLALGLDIGFIPYKNTGQQMTDTISGQIHLSIPSLSGGLPTVSSGDVRAIAIGTLQRTPLLADVPTIAEASNVKDFESVVWYGFLGPEGMPKDIVTKLSDNIKETLNSPRFAKVAEAIGAQPAFIGPDQFAAVIKQNTIDAKDLITRLSISPQD